MLLKIRSRSPKSDQLFAMSQLYIHEILVRIKPLVNKILCRQECQANANINNHADANASAHYYYYLPHMDAKIVFHISDSVNPSFWGSQEGCLGRLVSLNNLNVIRLFTYIWPEYIHNIKTGYNSIK